MPERNHRYAAGMATRREVLGAEYVDAALENKSPFAEPFGELVTEFCWDAIWNRPGLNRSTRSLLNLAMLAALRQWSEFSLHVRGAIRNGCTPDDIREVLLQVSVYCGIPAGLEAFKNAYSVLDALGEVATYAEPEPQP